MEESRIKRINELYHKSQAEGLTEDEKKEQALLRQEYVASRFLILSLFFFLSSFERASLIERISRLICFFVSIFLA